MSENYSDFVVGGVARDEDYVFHCVFVEELWETLKKDNVLLLSPRRTGKTSAMYRMLDKPCEGYRVIHLNVEDLATPADFYLSLLDAIKEHQPDYLKQLSRSWGVLKNLVGKLDEVGFMDFKVKLRESADWRRDWQNLGSQLMREVTDSDESVLFIIDELPDMLASIKAREPNQFNDFLHHFRKIRIGPQAGKVRWLVGGSVNIRGMLDELGLIKLINDLKTEILPVIEADEIHDFVTSMLDRRGVAIDPALVPQIHALLGQPIPYFLQLFTQELFRYWRRKKPAYLNADHASEVFRSVLLSEAAHDKLQHYHSRIRLYYPPADHAVVYRLLDKLSQVEDSIREKSLHVEYLRMQETQPISTQFKSLLLRLQSDFYIDKQGDGTYRFNSFLLKAWWRKNWSTL